MRGSSRPSSGLGSAILSYDIETIAPPAQDGGFPPWPTHSTVAIGYAEARCSGDEWTFDISATVLGGEVDEAAMLVEADRRMAAVDVVCGYNSRQFDALCLRLAAQRARQWQLQALADHADAPRYGTSSHVDLVDMYASYGRKVGLADLCDAIGIPVKTSTTGGDVGALWEAGNTERIRQYVEEDVVATLALYFSWTAARLADEALVTKPMTALARHIEVTPALAHLQPIVDCSLTRWSRPRALQADIAAALTRVTDKLQREEENRRFA